MATSSKQQHWLIGVAGRAGLGDLRDIRLPLDISSAHAWEKAATALDISQEELARHVAETFCVRRGRRAPFMRAVMERLGFNVVEAVDGEEALRHLAGDEDLAVMLLDLKMPGIDGLEVLNHVRRTLKTAALPVVVLTASEDPYDQILLLAAGADDYIKKPVDPPWAVNWVQAVLRRASRERSLITA